MDVAGLNGMNNVRQSGSFLSNKGIVTPEVILNADVGSDALLTKRDGQIKKISLSGAHSLWGGSVVLCVANNKLCRLIGESVTEICDIEGKPSYAEINGLIYISSLSFTGIYNPTSGLISDWGMSLPCAPQCVPTSGDFHPGRYCLCYTRIDSNGQISGTGPFTEIEWAGNDSGIKLENIEDDYLVWITDVNGADYFLATVESDKIVTQHYNKPLPSLLCTPPRKMSLIVYAHGRMWGVEEGTLYYSEPSTFDWWKESNAFFFDDEIIMIAPISTGIYIASKNVTYALQGTDPSAMTMRIVGDGVVSGSLTFGEFGANNSESLLPMWMGQSGFVLGGEDMHPINLTDGTLDINMGVSGAALSRNINGEMQVLVSMPHINNNAIGNIFNDGKIFIP